MASNAGLPDFIPVSPLMTDKGALAQLVGWLGEDSAKPVPLTDAARALNNFRITMSEESIAMAASLNYASIFKGSISANDRAFSLDAMAFTDQYNERATPGGIFATRWGVGMRVFLRVRMLTSNLSLEFATVGAAVELKLASAQYEIIGIGIPADCFAAALDSLGTVGTYTYETYLKIHGDVAKAIGNYIKNNKEALDPQPVAVAAARNLDPIAAAKPYYYAMRKIADRIALGEALADAPSTLDRDTIRMVYASFAQTDSDSATPSREAERHAEDWLRT